MCTLKIETYFNLLNSKYKEKKEKLIIYRIIYSFLKHET